MPQDAALALAPVLPAPRARSASMEAARSWVESWPLRGSRWQLRKALVGRVRVGQGSAHLSGMKSTFLSSSQVA